MACLIILFVTGTVNAAFVIYNDRSAWEAAVNNYREETFDDDVTPGISFASGYTSAAPRSPGHRGGQDGGSGSANHLFVA